MIGFDYDKAEIEYEAGPLRHPHKSVLSFPLPVRPLVEKWESIQNSLQGLALQAGPFPAAMTDRFTSEEPRVRVTVRGETCGGLCHSVLATESIQINSGSGAGMTTTVGRIPAHTGYHTPQGIH